MKINDEQLDIVEYEDLDYGETAEADTETQYDEALAEQTEAPVKKIRTKLEVFINVVLWVAIAVLATIVVLRLFVYNSVEVSGESMTPTYQDKEIVVVNKVIKPERGDVVVFYKNEVNNKFKAMFASADESAEGQPYEKLIKRVVAVEGDKLWANRVAVNGVNEVYQVIVLTADGERLCEDFYVKKGERLEQSTFLIETVAPTGLGILTEYSETNPFVVSKNCFFAMGDHRYNSADSRIFGEFPLSRLFGVVLDK